MKSTNKVRKTVTKALALPLYASVDLPGALRGVRCTETGLIVEREFSKHEWNSIGKKLAVANNASKWLIGDWMVMGPNAADFKVSTDQMDKDRKNHRRIERGMCVEFAKLLGVSPGHISNYASACKRVPQHLRHGLTMGHAVEILRGKVPDREFPKWRDRVIEEGLSCKQLRKLLRQSLRTEQPSLGTLRPPIAAAEFMQCVRTFNAECDNWTPEQWECYRQIFEPIIEAFRNRRPPARTHQPRA